ncbi:PcfB family protein [Bengtsoniella intestinalis]|uniref:PcfB family protein n=1 Tax=Bengtsoniella intestinalis TaxID=3073143 RepID=UPI00391F8374
MTTGGGEAADQMVRMMLTGSEVTIRLGASALKNLIALSVALAKQNKTLHGKVNMAKILRQTRDIRVFPMDAQQYKQFQRQAKGQKILYSAIKDKATGAVDLVMPVTELDRANHIFNRIQYHDVKDNPLVQEEPAAPTHQRSNPERDETFTQGRPEGEHPPSPDSADTRVNSNTSTKGKAAQQTQTTHECPSLLERLKSLRDQQRKTKRSQRQRTTTKTKPKDR